MSFTGASDSTVCAFLVNSNTPQSIHEQDSAFALVHSRPKLLISRILALVSTKNTKHAALLHKNHDSKGVLQQPTNAH